MQNTPSTSPAVVSLHDEQARQRTDRADLDKGLEDTFPASDPVSQTSTTTAGPAADVGGNPNRETAPRVDQALEAVRARSGTQSSDFASEEIQAMRAEVKQMADSTRELFSASGRVTRSGLDTMTNKVRDRIHARPLAAVGWAAVIGYVYGMTR